MTRERAGSGGESEPGAGGPRPRPLGRDHFEVQAEIARGGMGRILAARDTELGREVAIKVLDGALLERPVAVRRFVEEAQIAGQLQHPGVVPVYEMGTMEDRRPWFAMKLVKGRTFAEVLADRSEATQELTANLRIFESVCQTLAYAHSKGVIHRDLKPANIMVGSFGEVLVLDWGLAKVLSQEEPVEEQPLPPRQTIIETVRSGSGSSPADSVVGSVMGTPAYMPPEQAMGQMASLDERADVFSLGAILCEILTGKPPYEGSAQERTVVLAAQARLEPARRRLATQGLDPALVELCLQCLAPTPPARPRDAGELARRVRAYFVGLADEARAAQLAAAEARVRAAGERRARRLTLGLSAAVVAALLSIGGALWWTGLQRERRQVALARTLDDTDAQVLALHRDARFEEALEVARASRRVIEEADEAREDLRERALGLEAMALERVEAERGRLALARRNERLVSRLDELRQRQIDSLFRLEDRELDRRFAQAFRDWGIELDSDEVDALAAIDALRESGIARQVVGAVDDWAGVKRKIHGSDAIEAQVLTAVAMDLDPDGVGSEIRRAILERDEERLLALGEEALTHDLGPEVLWTVAFSLYDFGYRIEVFRLVERGVRLYPASFLLNLAAAISNREQRRQDRALPFLQAACALRPQAGYARLLLGSNLYELGELPAAVDTLRQAALLFPEEPRVHYQLGIALQNMGRYREAVDAYRAALERDPQNRPLRFDLEAARFRAGELSRADFLALLDGSSVSDPSELVAFGFALSDHPDPAQRDPARALEIGERVLLVAPGAPEAWEIVIRSALGLGRAARALEALDGAASRVVHRSAVLRIEEDLLRARALHGLGREGEARRSFEEAQEGIADLTGGREPEWMGSTLFAARDRTAAALGLR